MSFSNAQKNMEARIEGFNKKEVQYKKMKERAQVRIDNARQKRSQMHETRAEKQDLIDRNEYKIRMLEERVKTLEYRIDASKQNLRLRADSNEEITKASQRLKDTLQKQSELQAQMIRGMRRKDGLEKSIQALQEKESKYRDKMKSLLERMKYQMERSDQCKKSVLEKVKNIKDMHAAMVGLEPKLREMYTRMRQAESYVFEMDEKVTRKENEIRQMHKDCIYASEDKERAFVELEVKRERKFKGPEALRYLAE